VLLKRYYDEPLAQASFLIGDTVAREAVVVDPHRDVDLYLKAAEAEHLRIVAVTETHIHADYLSGTRELARRAGATAYLSDEGDADWKYGWGHEPNVKLVRNGDAIRAGRVRLDVLWTPGHTPEHVSFVVTDEAASPEPVGVLTGDFVFAGDVGRPDLLERAANLQGTMERGARTLFASLARFRESLPGHLLLWPGHGPGSACGKNLGGLPVTSLAYERLTNWGVKTTNEAEFVREVLAGQPEPPVYFKHMKRMNKDGPAMYGEFREPPRLDDAGLPAALARGEIVVDLRPTKAVLAGAIPGAFSIPVGTSFPTWAGWLLPYDQPISLLSNDGARAFAAVRQLAMIGLDDVRGWYGPGAFEAWPRANGPLAVTPSIGAREAFERAARGELVLLDVRAAAEHAGGRVPGARHIPLGELAARARELPLDRPVAVFCEGGTRSRIGVSVLRRAGFTRLLDQGGGFVEHAEAGLPVE
jgi:hydroxyacylglutathione hydrolase